MKTIVLLKRGEAGEIAQKSIEDFIQRDNYNPPEEKLIVYDCKTDINKMNLNYDLLISMNYDKRITAPLEREIPCFNIHLSPLPKYAGYNQFYWAIRNDEKNWGITLHQIVYEFDKGDIAQQITFPISQGETARSLFDKSLKYIPILIDKNIEELLYAKKINLVPQDLSKRTFNTKNSVNFDEEINFDGSESCWREIRARYFPPLPSPKIKTSNTNQYETYIK